MAIAVLSEGFDGLIVDHALDVGQATQWVVLVQVNASAAGNADVGQGTVGYAGEAQEMAAGVFDALQRHFGIGVGDFTK